MGMAQIPAFLQEEVQDYWIKGLSTPATVLDIGANIGAFTLAAAAKWPQANIHSFEPMLQNYEKLKENAGHCATLYPSAVGSHDGAAPMFVGENFLTGGFHDLGRQTKDTAIAQVMDASHLTAAEFIKIDTEGSELEIISRLDLSKAKGVVLEYHRASDVQPISDICIKAGLTLVESKAYDKELGILKFALPSAITKKKLFIGLPIYGAVDPHFYRCSMKMVSEYSVDSIIYPHIGDSAVGRARNACTRKFLDTDATDLLFIDSDLVFSNDQIKRILESEEDVVGGCYCKKQEGVPQLVYNSLPGEQEHKGDLLSVKYVGTGFLKVSRKALEKMIAAYGEEMWYMLDHAENTKEYDFWHMGVYQYPDGTRRFLSEDWWFCQKWLDLGEKVWMDLGIILKHSGNAVYPLKTQEDLLFGRALSPESAGAGNPPVAFPSTVSATGTP